jgi:hypothetical protein
MAALTDMVRTSLPAWVRPPGLLLELGSVLPRSDLRYLRDGFAVCKATEFGRGTPAKES